MKKIPLDKEQYSESSKRSVGYEYLDNHYADIFYKCFKCKSDAVFSAEDQKVFYEVKKQYMWSEYKLCFVCWSEYSNLKKELEKMELWYVKNKVDALKNKEFLHRWHHLLSEYMKYGKKGNPSIAKSLLAL